MTTEKKPEGMRFSSGKMAFWSQIPKDALVAIMRVYHIGGIKYDPNNWLKGMKYSDMANPLERHWMLWSMGDTRDAETRCHHLAHVAWNAIGLLTYELRKLGIDDRTKLPINSDFSWTEGSNHAELDIGLTKEELDELAVKYAKNKEEHKKASAPVKVEEIVATSPGGRGVTSEVMGYAGKAWEDRSKTDDRVVAQVESALNDVERKNEQVRQEAAEGQLLAATADLAREFNRSVKPDSFENNSHAQHVYLAVYDRSFKADFFPRRQIAFIEEYARLALSYCEKNQIAINLDKFYKTLESLSDMAA